MGDRVFTELLQARWAEGRFLCVGLDTAHGKVPARVYESDVTKGSQGRQDAFNRRIVAATKDLVCAYKPNAAFYEAEGTKGIIDLISTVRYIRANTSEVPVILDAKRGDIGNTNDGYVKFAFDTVGADAITVHPTLGLEAMKPFLDRGDKGVIVLVRTSNPGAGEFQDRLVQPTEDEASQWGISTAAIPLYQLVAYRVSHAWNYNGNCAVVVGATYPEELGIVRNIVGDLPILIPGVGSQGGDLEKSVTNGINSQRTGIIVNNSRGVIFAYEKIEGCDPNDFDKVARGAAQQTHDDITAVLQAA